MRRTPTRRESRLVQAAMGASILAIPATALAAAPTQHPAATPAQHPNSAVHTSSQRRHVAYEHKLVFTGRAPASDHGGSVTLRFLPAGAGHWRQVASGTVGDTGNFRLVARLSRSGWLKATIAASPSGSPTAPLASSASTASPSSSKPAWVQVAAAIRVSPRSINQLGTRTADLRGQVLPARPGRWVLLQGQRSGGWTTLAASRTGRRGTFDLRVRPTQATREQLRIRFGGDRFNGAAASRAGSLTVYQPAVASWYNDAGNTACGFHAYYGVASPSLPCGTQVSFMYAGRTVHAVVDDRGPFIAGRSWDLNQNTAGALGFGGVDTVWTSY